MKQQQLQSILFNIGGGFIVLTVVGYIVAAEIRGKAVSQCTARYQPGYQFSLQNGKGELLSPIELQAQAGSREWGVLQNTKVIKASAAPLGMALQVSLAPTNNEDREDQNGLGYVWLVPPLQKASSACLSYSAYIPIGFKFPEPGYMPGLFGGTDLAGLDLDAPPRGVIARMGWVSGGELGVEVKIPNSTGHWMGAIKTTWPTARWVAIEQEVKLNTPGKSDGLVRVWVDGDLKVETLNMDLRGSDQFALSGVVADVGYARTASLPATFHVSPFVVQWQ
jgi:hypothetical protein